MVELHARCIIERTHADLKKRPFIVRANVKVTRQLENGQMEMSVAVRARACMSVALTPHVRSASVQLVSCLLLFTSLKVLFLRSLCIFHISSRVSLL